MSHHFGYRNFKFSITNPFHFQLPSNGYNWFCRHKTDGINSIAISWLWYFLVVNCLELVTKWSSNHLMAIKWAFGHPMATELGWECMRFKNESWFHFFAIFFPLWVLCFWLHPYNHYLKPWVA
jgi:hypothetical protein